MEAGILFFSIIPISGKRENDIKSVSYNIKKGGQNKDGSAHGSDGLLDGTLDGTLDGPIMVH